MQIDMVSWLMGFFTPLVTFLCFLLIKRLLD